MASSWDKGDRVKIRGLTSEAGLQLNGQLGRVTQLANETGRLEVGLDGGRLVRVKAESLQLQDEVDDSSWSSGDQVRLVGLSATQEEELQKLHSSLGFLHRRLPRQKWSVQVQAKTYILHARHLRVCTKAENACWGSAGRRPLLLGAGLAATVLVLIGSELACRRLSRLRLTGEVPGPASAALPLVATSGSLLWIVATVCGCYAMHRSLMDPEVPFPQISELAVGPDAAKLLYRVGFASSAALLASVVQLHRDLGLPHLPGGRAGEAGEEFSFYGLLAAGGVALQGVALLDPAMTLQTMLHLAGALVFFWASWCHTSAAAKLYLPGWSMPAEESPEYQQVVDAMEAAEDSKLLAVPAVWWLVRIRHKVLMRGPLAMFLGPLVMQFLERSQDRETGMAQSPRTRNWMGILQWLVVANFALIFFSYGPELAIAAMLPLPQED